MKIVICDYKEPLSRDLDREVQHIKKGLGEDTEVIIYEYKGDRDELKELLKDADGVLTSYLEFDADLISCMKKCRGISIEATGYNFVDADACENQNMGVAVIAEYCTQEVADHCMTLLLAISRKLKFYNNDIERKKSYDYNATCGMIRLEGSTLGIMGFGKIGKALAKRAQGFGLNVIAYSPSCTEEIAKEYGVTLATPDEIYAQSHLIALTMRLTPENENIINADAFAKMKNKPAIANIARGALIDESALVKALDDGTVFGAGLDVLREETAEYACASPLAYRDDVIMTPHSAFYSDFALEECQRIASENLVYMVKGELDKVFRMVNNIK
ncbi:MAG: NAD(P)-dependent oxidoreductase [Clostridia bacterium]